MSEFDARRAADALVGKPPRIGVSIRGPLHGWGEPDTTPHTVYVHLAADETVLYAGCTNDLAARTAAHRRQAKWWPMVAEVREVGVWPREIALAVEKGLIAHYDPPGNYVGTPAWRKNLAEERFRGGDQPNSRANAKPLASAS